MIQGCVRYSNRVAVPGKRAINSIVTRVATYTTVNRLLTVFRHVAKFVAVEAIGIRTIISLVTRMVTFTTGRRLVGMFDLNDETTEA